MIVINPEKITPCAGRSPAKNKTKFYYFYPMRTLLFIITCCVLVSCSGKKTKPSTPEIKIADLINNSYYYIHLKGTLGDQPVTMDLIKSGPWVYKGFYTYDKVGEPITVWGSVEDDKITLNEFTSQTEDRFFKGSLDSTGTFKGIWRGKGTSYPFTLKAGFKDAIALNVYYAADSLQLLPGNPNSPLGEASNSILWPTAQTNEETAEFIRQSITGGKSVRNVQQYIRRDIDSFLATYKVTANDIDSSDGISPAYSWSADGDMKVVWNQYPLLCLEYFAYEFTGGAHGNFGANYQVLDLEKKKVLKPEDIFKPEYKTAMVPLLEKAFRKTFKVDPEKSIESMLLEKEIKPNDNFYITDKGVAFSYTPYEIAPYAAGQITLFIPFADIKPLMK